MEINKQAFLSTTYAIPATWYVYHWLWVILWYLGITQGKSIWQIKMHGQSYGRV